MSLGQPEKQRAQYDVERRSAQKGSDEEAQLLENDQSDRNQDTQKKQLPEKKIVLLQRIGREVGSVHRTGGYWFRRSFCKNFSKFRAPRRKSPGLPYTEPSGACLPAACNICPILLWTRLYAL